MKLVKASDYKVAIEKYEYAMYRKLPINIKVINVKVFAKQVKAKITLRFLDEDRIEVYEKCTYNKEALAKFIKIPLDKK